MVQVVVQTLLIYLWQESRCDYTKMRTQDNTKNHTSNVGI